LTGEGDYPTIPGMDRRRFLLTSLAGALAGPVGAEAQQAAKPMVRRSSLVPHRERDRK